MRNPWLEYPIEEHSFVTMGDYEGYFDILFDKANSAGEDQEVLAEIAQVANEAANEDPDIQEVFSNTPKEELCAQFAGNYLGDAIFRNKLNELVADFPELSPITDFIEEYVLDKERHRAIELRSNHAENQRSKKEKKRKKYKYISPFKDISNGKFNSRREGSIRESTSGNPESQEAIPQGALRRADGTRDAESAKAERTGDRGLYGLDERASSSRLSDQNRRGNGTADREIQGKSQSSQGFKPIHRSVNVRAKPTIEEAVSEVKTHGITYDLISRVFSPEIADILEDLAHAFKRNIAFKLWTQTYQLAEDAVKVGIPHAKALYKSMCNLQSKKQELQREIKGIENDFLRLSKESRERVNRFLEESTISGKWGYQPKWVPAEEWNGTDEEGNFQGNSIDAETQKKWNALSQAERDVIDEVLQYGYAQGKKAEETIDRMREEMGIKTRKRMPKFVTPYVPLVRKGGILVVYKSKDYADLDKKIDTMSEEIAKLEKQAEELSNKGFSDKALRDQIDQLEEDRKKLRADRAKLRKQEAHYVVSFEESGLAAGRIERELKAKYGDRGTVERKAIAQNSVRGPNEREKVQVFADVREKLEGRFGEETAKILGGELNEIFSQVTERGLTDATKRRENIAGYNKNIMQGFVEHNMGLANRIANASEGLEVAKSLAACREDLNSLSGEQQRNAVAYFNELESRVHKNTRYDPETVFDKFSSGARQVETFRLLSLKPSYYIQNALQPLMMTFPTLAGRFGAGPAQQALLEAYQKYGKLVKERLDKSKNWEDKFKTLSNLVEEILDDPKADLTIPERKMLRDMVNLGLIDMGVEQDFGEISGHSNRLFNAASKAAKYVSGAARTVEIVNRFSSAVAAYNLATKNGTMTPKQATEFVTDILNRTQGDYGAINAAPIFNTKLGKLALQFRKFQVIQFSYFADQLKQALRGATPEERAIAKRQLMYGMGVHAALGGVMGLPAATTMVMLLGALGNAFGDDDGEDGEQMFRRLAIDTFGKDLGSVVVNGIFTPLGVNLTNQVGAGTMMSLTPFSKKQLGQQDGVKEVLFSLMGPFVSDVARFHDSIVNSNSENGYRPVIEAALPKGIPQLLKSVGIIDMRYNAKTGEKMFNEVSNTDRFWSALGYTSETESNMYGLYSATKNVTDKRNQDYLTLKKRYLHADQKERMRIQSEWNKLNAFWNKRVSLQRRLKIWKATLRLKVRKRLIGSTV